MTFRSSFSQMHTVVDPAREQTIILCLNVIAAIKQPANFCENWKAGIYIRIPELTNFGQVRVTL